MACSLSSPGSASSTPSLTMTIRSPSHSFLDISTGSTPLSIPMGTSPASMISTPSSPIIKVGTAPSFMASRTPVCRSMQLRSRVAGCCSGPASKSTVFTSLRAALGENPVSRSCSVSSTTCLLSLAAVSPLPIPSERLMTTWFPGLSQKV